MVQTRTDDDSDLYYCHVSMATAKLVLSKTRDYPSVPDGLTWEDYGELRLSDLPAHKFNKAHYTVIAADIKWKRLYPKRSFSFPTEQARMYAIHGATLLEGLKGDNGLVYDGPVSDFTLLSMEIVGLQEERLTLSTIINSRKELGKDYREYRTGNVEIVAKTSHVIIHPWFFIEDALLPYNLYYPFTYKQLITLVEMADEAVRKFRDELSPPTWIHDPYWYTDFLPDESVLYQYEIIEGSPQNPRTLFATNDLEEYISMVEVILSRCLEAVKHEGGIGEFADADEVEAYLNFKHGLWVSCIERGSPEVSENAKVGV